MILIILFTELRAVPALKSSIQNNTNGINQSKIQINSKQMTVNQVAKCKLERDKLSNLPFM